MKKAENKDVLKGMDWHKHLINSQFSSKKQEEMYNCTHNYVAIYLLEGYYFAFGISRGYKNLASLKRLV
jgi:hypothetical protein